MSGGLRFDRCRVPGCRARVIWTTSAATGKRMLVDAEQTIPGTRGAFVLIGAQAFTEPMAVAQLGHIFGVDDAEAYDMARDYGWHLAHQASCITHHQARGAIR